MRKLIVEEKENQKKLIPFLQSKFRKMPQSALYKALRNKDIKVNGTRTKENITLQLGDEIEVYIKDDILFGRVVQFQVDEKSILYEDENLLIYHKPAEIEVQGKNGELGLEGALQEQLQLPFLKACHRLDRNTTGLVIFAKTKQAEDTMLSMLKSHAIRKYYKTLVYGIPKNKAMTLKAYLWKDSKNSQVIISDTLKKGYQEIITKYRVLEIFSKENMALLEIELVTGKTHQIRAHLAHIGYPIVGDGKYGKNQINKQWKKKYQQLCSYKLVFEEAEGILAYMKGKIMELKKNDWEVF